VLGVLTGLVQWSSALLSGVMGGFSTLWLLLMFLCAGSGRVAALGGLRLGSAVAFLRLHASLPPRFFLFVTGTVSMVTRGGRVRAQRGFGGSPASKAL